MSEKKLFLLDAMALIYRAHFAFSKAPRITSKGLNTSAVFGFANSLLDIIKNEKPTHIGVAFDLPGPTLRHERFTEYKANRQEQPEDISIAIPLVRRLLEALCIPVLEMRGYEADDLVGTLAKKAAREGFDVYMMTMDKDYMQLVEEHIFLYRPAYLGNGAEVYDIPKVLERFGIENVDQVRDILGLQGDAVDNIPGIPGIGEKTAQKLIAQYGSVENLIANAHELKGKQKENVIAFAEQGLLSKELATIEINVPVEFDEKALLQCEPKRELLIPLLEELEFKNLSKRLLGEELPVVTQAAKPKTKPKISAEGTMSLFGDAPATEVVVDTEGSEDEREETQKDNIHTRIHDYRAVDTEELMLSLLSHLMLQKEVCFDTETTSLDSKDAELVGLSFAYLAGEAFYVPVPADQNKAQEIVNLFKPFFENVSISKIGQNIKYDILVLKNYGIDVNGPLFDTMIAHYLLEPDMRHNMDMLSSVYLNYKPVSIEELIGKKGISQGNMRDVALDKITAYASEDADVTLQLKHYFAPMLKTAEQEKLFHEVETPLSQVLADMEFDGVKIDSSALKDYSQILAGEIVELEKSIYEKAGVQFNISSPKQLGEVLFEKLKIDPGAKKTKTGQYATGEEILSKLSEHAIVNDILSFRELQKLKSTYIDALPQLIHPSDGRVHTSYNQAVAATGRLSSTNPNLQNIPIRTERGKEIRKAFVSKGAGWKLLSADYSQIELRIMADFSQDATMIEAFSKGEDIHNATASKVFNVAKEEVTSDMRRKAKMVNFGIIYGISAFGLSQRLSIPRKEAAEIIDSYFLQFPGIKSYMDSSIVKAREFEYVETILGRRRYLRDINSRNFTQRGFAERNAINAPIQGSAADLIKLAMINIQEWIKSEKIQSRMIMQVHDELVFDVKEEEIALVTEKVRGFMQNAIQLSVPLEVGMGVGDNWLEAH
ncbi:MAG: polA [Chitinophagaceae bacterium]|nr:polA [Chitinophagaceae bacterium]